MEELTVENLFNKHAVALTKYAFNRRKNYPDAQDIVQDVFIGVIRYNPQFENGLAAKAYLYRSVANKLVTLHRRDYFSESFTDDNDSIIPAISGDSIRSLHPHILRLPEGIKQIFLLYMQGWKQKEIAKKLRLNESTVRTQKARALRSLNKALRTGKPAITKGFV